VIILKTLSFSLLQPSKEPIPLEASFALIADADGKVNWWMRKTGAGDSARSTSDTHHPEESERENLTETDGTEVDQ